MSYQLGYEHERNIDPNSQCFKCMSYQLGYELKEQKYG